MTQPLEIEAHFVLELPASLRPLVAVHETEVTTSLGTALGLLFGLPLGTPVRVSCRFSERFQLVEVRGTVPREVTPDELTGCFVGVQATLVNLLFAERVAIPLNRERVNDA